MKKLDYFEKFVPLDFSECWDFVIDNPKFELWPGSVDKHHNWSGGLLQHTTEVINIAFDMGHSLKVDKGVLAVSCFWHDYGKLWSYKTTRVADVSGPDLMKDGWAHTEAYSLTGGHLARSYAEWIKFTSALDFSGDFVDMVGHCILSHHGCREWGSPARPQCVEAMVLHLADTCSARCLGGEPFPKK